MKKYITPDMKALSFAAMEAISSDDYSSENTNKIVMDWGEQANG